VSLTREKILELGEELILKRGYNAFSYQDISSELGIKNAAVHYYFPSKENLGTSIIKNNILRFEEMLDNLKTRKFDEYAQLEAFFKFYLKSNREDKICILGSLGSEFESLSESTKKELQKMSQMIIDWLTVILEKGRSKSLFKFNGEAKSRALLILTCMIAGLQLARVMGKSDFKAIHLQLLDDLKP
jgi:TetR/AcrR family transcriptional regulator, transcriptional repressor for nem operon